MQTKKNLFTTWRYYALPRDEYYQCMNRGLPSTLNSMWHLSLLFAFSNLNSAIRSFRAFSAGDDAAFSDGILFLSLIAVSLVFGLIVRGLYRRHRQGAVIRHGLIYGLGIFNYSLVMASATFRNVFLDPTRPSIIFAMFMICGLLLIFAPPPFNLTVMMAALAGFIFVAVSFMEPYYLGAAIDDAIFAAVVGAFFTWCVNAYRAHATMSEIQLEEERDKHRKQSTIDELTSLPNRRDFMQQFARYLNQHRKGDKVLCFAVADIDYFKYYNDFYGHPEGDECLRKIGAALGLPWENATVYAARIGGEEFALLWFEEEKQDADKVAEELRLRVHALQIPHEKSQSAPHVTVSIGVCAAPIDRYDDTQVIYNLADKALYEAKATGRDRVVIV